jgi:hypothetical protein
MAEDGEPEEALAEVAVPEPLEDWLFASFFPVNMLFLYQRWLERRAAVSVRSLPRTRQ